jgi:hypothetical protein
MKTLMAFIAALALTTLVDSSLLAAEAPRGDLLEIHSCQLYIGGCIASSEATLEGKTALRVWHFTSGSHQGIDFGKLQVALLEISDQNLATSDAKPTEAVIYLPASATRGENVALIDWVKGTNPQLANAKLHTRVVAMRFANNRGDVAFSGGEFVALAAKPFVPCGLTSCGEALWYTPRSAMTAYTVEVAEKVSVNEPLLALRWIDHGKNNVFSGRFGEGRTTVATFNPPTMMCAVAEPQAHE